METPKLNDASLVDLAPDFFDRWIIDYTCSRGMDRFDDSSRTSMECRFRTNAAALAADVAGAGYDWEHAARTFSAAAFEKGVTREKADVLLAEAWRWGKAHPTKWMDLTRRWIFVESPGAFYEMRTGIYLSDPEFDDGFDDLCPLPGWSMSEFLLEHKFVTWVYRVTRDRRQPVEFYEAGGIPFFNHP